MIPELQGVAQAFSSRKLFVKKASHEARHKPRQKTPHQESSEDHCAEAHNLRHPSTEKNGGLQGRDSRSSASSLVKSSSDDWRSIWRVLV